MKSGLGHALTTLILASLLSTSAFARDEFAERIIATYSTLESYCDTVATKDHWYESELRRCYTRDGRYKVSEQLAPAPAQHRLKWGDNFLSYTWYTHPDAGTTLYMERPALGPAENLPDGLPARALKPFLRYASNENDVRKILREMEVVEDGPETMILQRARKNPGSGNNVIYSLRVRRSDGLVTYGHESSNGRVLWSAKLIDTRINAPLTQADLTETAPFFRRFFHRYNLQTRPVEFVSGLAAIAFAVGVVLSIFWRRPRKWRCVWVIYAKLSGVAIGILAALTAVSLLPGMRGGHPPIIVLVFILAAFAGIGMLAIATLLLGMQLVDLVRTAIKAPPT